MGENARRMVAGNRSKEAADTIAAQAKRIEAMDAALREVETVAQQYGVKKGPAQAMRLIARAALANTTTDDRRE